jgi:hypothetical protein
VWRAAPRHGGSPEPVHGHGEAVSKAAHGGPRRRKTEEAAVTLPEADKRLRGTDKVHEDGALL